MSGIHLKCFKTGGNEDMFITREFPSIYSNSTASKIATAAFYNYYNDKNIDFESVFFNNVKTVGSMAFYNCDKLKTITMPNCESISEQGLGYCMSLQNINMPKLKYVDDGVFSHCSILSSIDFPLCERVGESCFENCDTLANVNLSNCLSIGDRAFHGCSSLQTINIDKCEYIGSNAFYGCINLQSIKANVSILSGDHAFANCSNMSYAEFPELLETITYDYAGRPASPYTFSSCIRLASVSMPKLQKLGGSTFCRCYSLSSIDLPECTYLGNQDFYNCSSLTIVKIGKLASFYSSNPSPFYGCSNLREFHMPYITSVPELTMTYNALFYDCSSVFEHIYVPASLMTDFAASSAWWSFYSSYFSGIY